MNQIPKVRPHRNDLKPGECLCDYCSAKCCRYFTVAIEEPETRADFDMIRWYLVHEHTTIFVEEGAWYLLVHAVCKNLQEDNRCGIYSTRPKICASYSTENCEYDDDYTYEQYFETAQQMNDYIDARFGIKPTGAGFRSPKPEMFPILNQTT